MKTANICLEPVRRPVPPEALTYSHVADERGRPGEGRERHEGLPAGRLRSQYSNPGSPAYKSVMYFPKFTRHCCVMFKTASPQPFKERLI